MDNHMTDDDAFPNALPRETRIGPVVLDRPIGQGAWGIVYEGRHDQWGRVAVKEFFPAIYSMRKSGGLRASAPQWQDAVRKGLERFAHEGRTLRTIRHENVVPVYEFLEEAGSAFLVMDYIEGETLQNAVDAGRFRDPAVVMKLAETLVDTLHAIHTKNILHRDIAPDNIMIRADGSPVLIDFGGAAAAVASATRSTQNIVKDGYSPPEQYDTADSPTWSVGPWSDIYATSSVLYRLAAGREPAVSNARLLALGVRGSPDPLIPLKAVAPSGYSATWIAAVDRGTALSPAERPQSANEWREHFSERISKKRGPDRLIAGIAAGILGGVALAAGLFFWMSAHNRPVTPPIQSATRAVQVARPLAAVKHPPQVHRKPPGRPTPQHVAAKPAPRPAAPAPVVHPVAENHPAAAQPPVVRADFGPGSTSDAASAKVTHSDFGPGGQP